MSIPFLNQYKGAAQGFEHCSNVDHRRFSRKSIHFSAFLISCPKLFLLWSLRIGMCSPVNLLLKCFLVLIQMYSITIQIQVGNVSKLYIYVICIFTSTKHIGIFI